MHHLFDYCQRECYYCIEVTYSHLIQSNNVELCKKWKSKWKTRDVSFAHFDIVAKKVNTTYLMYLQRNICLKKTMTSLVLSLPPYMYLYKLIYNIYMHIYVCVRGRCIHVTEHECIWVYVYHSALIHILLLYWYYIEIIKINLWFPLFYTLRYNFKLHERCTCVVNLHSKTWKPIFRFVMCV